MERGLIGVGRTVMHLVFMSRYVIMLAASLLLAGCAERVESVLAGRTMGTTFSVKYLPGEGSDENGLLEAVEARLNAINQRMSTYIDDSELMRLNRSPVGEWVTLSPDTAEVLALALEISALSDGGFDMTVGPLVNLWGFGPAGADQMPRRIPDASEIDAARALVGWRHVTQQGDRVRRERPVQIDLSAVAKGYAVDQIAEILDDRLILDYLVEIGGELRGRGLNRRGVAWRIGIEIPDELRRRPYVRFAVRDAAVATSGDYRNYFEENGRRYSHTIDPATGAPISHQLASVTVLAPTAARADALATALNVLGPERGMALAEKHKLAALFIIKGADGFEDLESAEMSLYLQE